MAFIVEFGILTSVHEFGHFWVARHCKVLVKRFSIGFGKVILRCSSRCNTEFVIALIPLGGYIKMLDERLESVVPEIRQYAFNNKTAGQRMAIITAGSIANFIFAFFIYWLVFIIGVPSIKPIVGEIIPNSIADSAQIIPGMELKAVDGVKTYDWDAVRLQLVSKLGNDKTTLSVTSFGSNRQQDKILDLSHWIFELNKEDPITALGIYPFRVQVETVLEQVQANSAASKAGLQPGDKIVKVNGQTLTQWTIFINLVRNNLGKSLVLDVEREGSLLSLTLIPDSQSGSKTTEGFAGVVPKIVHIPNEYKTLLKYGPLDAIIEAMNRMLQVMKLTLQMLGKLITGKVNLHNINGPISIAKGARISAKFGVIQYLMFLALMSINLGIINLFPLPVLDGGHLLFLAIEKLKGWPISKKIQDIGYLIGLILLVLLMGLALFNDFSRL